MRWLLLGVLALVSCGSVASEGSTMCPATTDGCTTVAGTITGPGGQPATRLDCGSVTIFQMPNYANPAQPTECCFENEPSGWSPSQCDWNMCLGQACN